MTVTVDDIADVSPYVVDDSKTFTTARFQKYAAIAQKRLDADTSALEIPEDVYDYLHALLICHIYESRKGTIEATGSQPNGWVIKPGETSYLNRYKDELKSFQTTTKSEIAYPRDAVTTITRCDSEMPQFALDDNPTPTFFTPR